MSVVEAGREEFWVITIKEQMLHSLSFSDAFLQMHVRAGCHRRKEGGWRVGAPCAGGTSSFAAVDYHLSPCFPDLPAHLGSVRTMEIPADLPRQSLRSRGPGTGLSHQQTHWLLGTGKSGNHSPRVVWKGVDFVREMLEVGRWMINNVVEGTILALCLLRSCWKNIALMFLNALKAPASIFLSKLVQEQTFSP